APGRPCARAYREDLPAAAVRETYARDAGRRAASPGAHARGAVAGEVRKAVRRLSPFRAGAEAGRGHAGAGAGARSGEVADEPAGDARAQGGETWPRRAAHGLRPVGAGA